MAIGMYGGEVGEVSRVNLIIVYPKSLVAGQFLSVNDQTMALLARQHIRSWHSANH